MTNTYSREIAQALKKVLNERGWNYIYSSKFNDFRFVTAPDCGILKYVSYYISIHKNAYTVYASFPLGVCGKEFDRHHLASKYLHNLNQIMPVGEHGTWMIDMDGVIAYKYSVLYTKELSADTIEDSLDYPAARLQKFAKVFLNIIMDPDPVKTLSLIEEISRFIAPGDLMGELTLMESCIKGEQLDSLESYQLYLQAKEAEGKENDEHQG